MYNLYNDDNIYNNPYVIGRYQNKKNMKKLNKRNCILCSCLICSTNLLSFLIGYFTKDINTITNNNSTLY